MKKIIFSVLFTALLCASYSQSFNKTTGDNNVIVYSLKSNTSASNILKTEYVFKDKNDIGYNIFINTSTGRCFILKVSSKTGKEYKYYLPKDICLDICKSLGIEYKENTHNNVGES